MNDLSLPGALDWNLRLRQSPALEIREVTDGFVVYQADRDRIHFLNPTATFLLESCSGTLRAADLPPLLATAFGLGEPPVADVAACLQTLLAEGLLVEPAGAEP